MNLDMRSRLHPYPYIIKLKLNLYSGIYQTTALESPRWVQLHTGVSLREVLQSHWLRT